MSTVKAANLQNTGSGAPAFQNSSGTEIGQLCKAWLNFDGSGTVAIRDSFNVSSITDIATGRYSVHFTTAFANANYVAAGSGGNLTGTSGNMRSVNRDGEWTTGIAYIRNIENTSTAKDDSGISVMFIGA